MKTSIDCGFVMSEFAGVAGFVQSHDLNVFSGVVDVQMVIDVDDMWIEFHSFQEKFRPFLRLTGLVDTVRGNLPCEVREVSLREVVSRGASSRVDVIYEFNDEELSRLVAAGFYDKDFEIPQRFRSNRYEFPWKIHSSVIEPQNDADAPVVFVDLLNQHDSVFDSATCGYDFANLLVTDRQIKRNNDRDKNKSLNTVSFESAHVLGFDENSRDDDNAVMDLDEALSILANVTIDSVEETEKKEAKIQESSTASRRSTTRTRVSVRQFSARKRALAAAEESRLTASRLAMRERDGELNSRQVERVVRARFTKSQEPTIDI